MAIDIGHHIGYRWQGMKQCCWLTSIEMLMQHKYGSIYGRNSRHSNYALEKKRENNGSHVMLHQDQYNLAGNTSLRKNTTIGDWENALRKGPVLAEGNFGMNSIGLYKHVVVIIGVSRTKKLVYFNPNLFSVFPHAQTNLSYISVERCIKLAKGSGDGPFWQVREDIGLLDEKWFDASDSVP